MGSLQYYPSINNLLLGAIFFCLGGTAFLFADVYEWWMNNRVGCFMYEEFLESYEKSLDESYEPEKTCLGKFQRAQNGLNFSLSAFGSGLYFIGGFFFIPSFNSLMIGTWIFICGSAVIVVSQTWKLLRAMSVQDDLPAFGVDLAAGFGGLCYFIGSIYFLPSNDTSDRATIVASNWFVGGGVSYTISGIFMVYRYFFTLNYPHEEVETELTPLKAHRHRKYILKSENGQKDPEMYIGLDGEKQKDSENLKEEDGHAQNQLGVFPLFFLFFSSSVINQYTLLLV